MVKITFDVPRKMREAALSPRIQDAPYDLCGECPFHSVTCDGPNEFAMTVERWVSWSSKLAKERGMTRAQIAEDSGIPLATVNSIMSGRTEDPRHSTMQAISRAINSGCWGQYPCHFAALLINDELPEDDSPVEDLAALRKELDEANRRVERWRARVSEYESQKKADVAEAKADSQRQIQFLRGQIDYRDRTLESKDKTIKTLAAILGAVLCSVLGVLLFDVLNPDIGFFRY